MNKIELFALAQKAHEGWFDGSISWRCNNPGNIIMSDLARKHGAKEFYKHPRTGHEFAIFPAYENGWEALIELITNACTGKSKIYSPDWTILQYCTKYSPIRNKQGIVVSNYTYANDVAKRVGVSINTKLKDLLETTQLPPESTQPMFTQFNQLDYPKVYLGNTSYTVARWGCLSLVVNMGYNFLFGKNVQPPEIVKILSYSSSGNLLWPSLLKLDLKLVKRISQTSTPYDAINAGYKNPNQFVALEVKNGAHFVWLIGRYIPLLGYRIVNPFGGKKEYMKNGITGCRIIEKI
jgi:hypothetical protein